MRSDRVGLVGHQQDFGFNWDRDGTPLENHVVRHTIEKITLLCLEESQGVS